MGWFKLRRVVWAPPPASASDGEAVAAKHADWQELLLSRFQLLEVLGAGGYSTVVSWLAALACRLGRSPCRQTCPPRSQPPPLTRSTLPAGHAFRP